jgi:hypothetical protein
MRGAWLTVFNLIQTRTGDRDILAEAGSLLGHMCRSGMNMRLRFVIPRSSVPTIGPSSRSGHVFKSPAPPGIQPIHFISYQNCLLTA